MYYVQDELLVVVATNKDYDYIYVLDEESNSIKKVDWQNRFLMIVNTLAPPPLPIKSNQLNSTTIPNPNRLSATLMSVDEGKGSELR